MRMADVGRTVISSRLPSIVINASAKPSDNPLPSSTPLKKINGSTAIDVRGVGPATFCRRSPGSRTAAEGLENRVGHLISLRGTLAEKLLYDGGQLCMHQRRGMNRRWVVVKDRVKRFYR